MESRPLLGYLTLIYCLLPIKSFGEINLHEREHLISVLKNARDDSLKIENLILLSANYFDSTGLAFYYDSLALQLSIKLHSKYGVYQSLRQRGSVYEVNLRDYYTAIKWYKMAIDTVEYYHIPTTEDHSGYVNVLNAYFFLGDFANAMKTATARLALFEQQKNVAMQVYYCNLIGFIYLRQNNSRVAKKYYAKYVAGARQLNDTLSLGNAYTCMADVYTFDKDYPAAFVYLDSALSKYRLLPTKLSKPERIAYALYKIGNTYKLSGEYKQAENYTLRAIAQTKAGNCNEYDVAAYYINASDIYNLSGNYKEAKNYARYGLNLAKKIHHSEDIKDAYLSLSAAYSALKMYDSAYQFNVLYNELKDSIIGDKTKREIEQIHTLYEVDKKDKEIVLLNQQNRLRESDIARQKLLRNVVVVICLFIVIIGVLLYGTRMLRRENIFNAEMNRQKNKSFEALVTLQDKERKRIAQDIHDSLGSILSTAKLTFAGLDDAVISLDEKHKKNYFSGIKMIDEAITEMRHISHDIMPAILSKLGLVAALRNSIDSISGLSGLQVQFSTHDFDSRLDEPLEISIYRIIMELMNNIVKHAEAKNVILQLIVYPGYLRIMAEDDGKGFDYRQVKNKPGIGLVSITSRVDYLKGKLDIDSIPGQGTTVIIEVPLTSKN